MILVVKASGRILGKSNQIIDKIVGKFDDEIVTYDLNKLSIKGCTGCRACKTSDTFCVINDDLKSFWSDLERADRVIYGSPNYMGTINGQLKMLLDRHYCLTMQGGKSKLKNLKKSVLVFSQGYSDETSYLDEYKKVRDAFANQLNADLELFTYGGDEDLSKAPELESRIDNLVKLIK